MSLLEQNGAFDRSHEFEYPDNDFFNVAKQLSVFDTPDVAHLHDWCLHASFDDEVAYNQAILAVLHAYDLAYMEGLSDEELRKGLPNETIQGIALCLADIHYKTGHYYYCFNELLVAAEVPGLESYLDKALEDIYARLQPGDHYPTPVTAQILMN